VQLEAKVNAVVKFDRDRADKRTLRFNLSMKAANPFIETTDVIVVSGMRAYEAGVIQLPVLYPTTMPLEWQQSITVANTGNSRAESTLRLYGSSHFNITNPTITNLTNGQFMTINTILTGVDQLISMNSKAGLVLDGNGNDLSGLLADGSEFIKLEIGNNILVYTSDENVGVTSPLVTRLAPDEKVEAEFRNVTL
jgi:hypothetical protein